MVLQNKYKAKASRRYNASKGNGGKNEAENSKPGFRQRHFRRFAPDRDSQQAGASGDENDDDDDDDDGQGDDDEDGKENSSGGEDEEVHDPRLPSLKQAAKTTQPSERKAEGKETAFPSTSGKYSRRRMGESNAVRMARLEAEKDPHLEGSEEEPEIDISSLMARVAALDTNAKTQAGVSADIAAQLAERETASDVERDIDHSLAWLHDKERQRQKAKGRGGFSDGRAETRRTDAASELQDVDAEGKPIDYEQMKREKEKAEALRTLKARFQGRALGERESRTAKARAIPSIQIGPHKEERSSTARGLQLDTSDRRNLTASPAPLPALASPEASSSSSGGSSDMGSIASSSSSHLSGANAKSVDDGNETSAVSDSVTAEIDASLNRQRKLARSGTNDSGSVSSQRSSFSTDFGRRRSPMTCKDFDPASGSLRPATDEIDSFLASLNSTPVKSTSLSASPSKQQQQQQQQQKAHARTKQVETSSKAPAVPPTVQSSPEGKAKQGRIHHFVNDQSQPKLGKKSEIESLESFLDDMLK